MARKKTTSARVNVKAQVSARLREVRLEQFGEHGGPELARRLGLPARTWYNYETGVTVPAEVLLSFIEQTGASPVWLLDGSGPKYMVTPGEPALADLSPQQLIRRGLEKLESEPREGAELNGGGAQEFLSLDLVPWSELCAESPSASPPPPLGRVLADRRWIPNPARTLAARLEDDAMAPILPAGSVVAVDRSRRDPLGLAGRLVAACVDGRPMVRWLELSERHLILRPNQASRAHPLVPVQFVGNACDAISGLVVWSWSRFDET